MDCCAAGGVVKGRHDHTRSFELLAATGRDLTTPRPGPQSYTCALIKCLTDMLDQYNGDPFTTFDLNQSIRKQRNWTTAPHLYNLMGYSTPRHIFLAPLPRLELREVQANREVTRNAGYLNLRIAFAEQSDLDDEQVRVLATVLSEAAKNCSLGVTDIYWMGFEPYQNSRHFQSLIHVARVYHRFRKALYNLREHKRQSSLKRKLDDPQPEECRSPRNMHIASIAAEFVRSLSTPPTPGTMSRATTPGPR